MHHVQDRCRNCKSLEIRAPISFKDSSIAGNSREHVAILEEAQVVKCLTRAPLKFLLHGASRRRLRVHHQLEFEDLFKVEGVLLQSMAFRTACTEGIEYAKTLFNSVGQKSLQVIYFLHLQTFLKNQDLLLA